MPHALVVPVVRRKDYDMSIEQFDDMTFAHCRVYRWSRQVFEAMRGDVEAFVRLHGGPLYAMDNDDPRQRKFLRIFGFKPHGSCEEFGGIPRTLYKKD